MAFMGFSRGYKQKINPDWPGSRLTLASRFPSCHPFSKRQARPILNILRDHL